MLPWGPLWPGVILAAGARPSPVLAQATRAVTPDTAGQTSEPAPAPGELSRTLTRAVLGVGLVFVIAFIALTPEEKPVRASYMATMLEDLSSEEQEEVRKHIDFCGAAIEEDN